jgi:hypothetical protein
MNWYYILLAAGLACLAGSNLSGPARDGRRGAWWGLIAAAAVLFIIAAVLAAVPALH